MTKKGITFFIIFFMILVSKPSFALGKLGHKIVCQLTFENLPAIKQAKVTKLLNIIPKKHQDLINRYNYQKKGSVITFSNACTWADAVKRLEKFKVYSKWHYMNVSREHSKIKANDCKRNCLPQAILKHQKILAQAKNQNNWQQAQALLFLGHWVGDIHQPLHVSFADDLGGNKIKFSHLETKCSNLHWYWDQCVLYKGKHGKTKWLNLLSVKWAQQSQPNWQKEQVWQWADESFQITKEPSFNYCQLNSEGSCQKPKGKIKLSSGYLKRYQVVMEQRLLQAAQRLTKMLEATL